jgi:hypothetical protein
MGDVGGLPRALVKRGDLLQSSPLMGADKSLFSGAALENFMFPRTPERGPVSDIVTPPLQTHTLNGPGIEVFDGIKVTDPASSSHRAVVSTEEQVRKAFNKIDQDKTGLVSRSNLAAYVQRHQKLFEGVQVTEDMLSDVIAFCTPSSKGKISIDEFLKMSRTNTIPVVSAAYAPAQANGTNSGRSMLPPPSSSSSAFTSFSVVDNAAMVTGEDATTVTLTATATSSSSSASYPVSSGSHSSSESLYSTSSSSSSSFSSLPMSSLSSSSSSASTRLPALQNPSSSLSSSAYLPADATRNGPSSVSEVSMATEHRVIPLTQPKNAACDRGIDFRSDDDGMGFSDGPAREGGIGVGAGAHRDDDDS